MSARLTLLLIAVTLTLGGCSSGGDGDAPPVATAGSAEGLYTGSTNTNRSIAGVVLDDGTYYVLYTAPANPNVIAGVVQGTGTSNNGAFTSSNARDFNLEGQGVQSATVAASYTARQSLGGSVFYAGGAVTFTSTFDPAYDTTPTLASLAGTYTGQVGSSGGVESATVTVANTGAFTGFSTGGCNFSGTATPRATGNIFDQSVTFGGAPCLFAGSTLVGVAFLDVPTRRLYAAAPNSTRTDGVIFSGIRP